MGYSVTFEPARNGEGGLAAIVSKPERVLAEMASGHGNAQRSSTPSATVSPNALSSGNSPAFSPLCGSLKHCGNIAAFSGARFPRIAGRLKTQGLNGQKHGLQSVHWRHRE